MVIVGLTGRIGTGKSTVAGFFKELGAHLIDWDQLARDVVKPHQRAWQGIVDYFGEDFLNHYGTDKEFSEHSEKRRAVLNFVKDFVSDESRHYLEMEVYSLKFENYDWSLNERTGPVVSWP